MVVGIEAAKPRRAAKMMMAFMVLKGFGMCACGIVSEVDCCEHR